VLELLQVLADGWAADKSMSAYSLVLLGPIGASVLDASEKNIEFASESMKAQFRLTTKNPFRMRGEDCKWPVQVETDIMNLKSATGKVVLVSGDGLESGVGRELFRVWAQDRKNLLFFTGMPAPGTLGRLLVDHPRTPEATITVKEKVPKVGAELVAHRAQQEREQAEEAAASAPVEESAFEKGGDGAMDSDDDEPAEDALLTHDLMEVRGGGAASTSYFRQTESSNMYPCPEDRSQLDEYGEMINHKDYIMEGDDSQDERGAAAATAAVTMDFDQLDNVIEAIPKKCVVRTETIQLKLQRKKIAGYEGRSDGESIMRILSQSVKPRSLILVHGSTKSTEEMEDLCSENVDMDIEKIETPAEGVCVNVTPKGNMYQVRLMDSLVSSMQFSRVQDHELAWLDALIHTGVGGDADQAVAMEVPTLVQVPKQDNRSARSAMFVGQPPLSEILEKLKGAGIEAVFNLGKVVCNDTIQISKNGTQYSLQGPLSEDYYTVREVLYKEFAIV
jgi:cleavage and polyadenylation specificity factor subunit 2